MDNEKITISKSDLRNLVIETAKTINGKQTPAEKAAADAKRKNDILAIKDTRKRQAAIRANLDLFRR